MNQNLSRARNLALTLTVLTAGLTGGLGGPASAAPSETPAVTSASGPSAGTIGDIKNHNVWIARGDGTGARPVTLDGSQSVPYGSPTQSDDGTVVATQFNTLIRMTQNGKVLNTIDPPALPTSVGTSIDGTPVDAAISPDGTRIVYTFTTYFPEFDGFRSATGYTAADRLTDPASSRSTFFWSPSWVGNSRTLQSGGSGHHVKIHDLGSDPVTWFDDDNIDVANAQLSRDGQSLAAVVGFGENSWIQWYAVNGDAQSGPAPGAPSFQCSIGPLEGISNPTWAPDSDSLAWEEPDGIWTRSGARDCSVPSSLILPGGSQPHWSPAALTTPAHGVDPGPGPGPGPGTGPGTGTPVPVVLTNTGRPMVKGKARPGQKLKATTGTWSVSGVSFTFQWFRNGKKVAGKSGRAQSYRVTRADRGKTLYVRVTATKGGVVTSARSKSAKVKR